MRIGPYYFYQCPSCGNILKNRSLTSGNTFGATYYSDGKRIAPMLPDIPNLTKCTKCNTILWLNDLKELGKKSVSSYTDYSDHPEWQNADRVEHLESDDLLRALEALNKSRRSIKRRQREIFVRQRIWWKYNRKDDIAEIDAWRENCLALLNLLDTEDNEQRCMAAELNRNLCNFSKCMELIKELPEKYVTFKIKMMEECGKKNPLTVEITNRKREKKI